MLRKNIRRDLAQHVVALAHYIDDYIADVPPCDHASSHRAHPRPAQMLESEVNRPNSDYDVNEE